MQSFSRSFPAAAAAAFVGGRKAEWGGKPWQLFSPQAPPSSCFHPPAQAWVLPVQRQNHREVWVYQNHLPKALSSPYRDVPAVGHRGRLLLRFRVGFSIAPILGGMFSSSVVFGYPDNWILWGKHFPACCHSEGVQTFLVQLN